MYQCPQGEYLKTNSTFYHKKNTRRRTYRFKRYTAGYKHCAQCPLKLECVGNRLKYRHGRSVKHPEYADAIKANAKSIEANKDYYRKRQAIVEPVCPAAPGILLAPSNARGASTTPF